MYFKKHLINVFSFNINFFYFDSLVSQSATFSDNKNPFPNEASMLHIFYFSNIKHLFQCEVTTTNKNVFKTIPLKFPSSSSVT
jgi:hypothetical protein